MEKEPSTNFYSVFYHILRTYEVTIPLSILQRKSLADFHKVMNLKSFEFDMRDVILQIPKTFHP